MKVKELAKKMNVKTSDLELFIIESGVDYDTNIFGMSIKDNDVDFIVDEFQKKKDEELNKQLRKKEEEAEKQRAMAQMLITSGFSFDGYTITKYSGYISGDDAIQIDRGKQGFLSNPTNVGDSLMATLVIIRRRALIELKEAAYDLGCNAVIGVDFDYITLEPETVSSSGGTLYLPYVFGVTANGNAVIIEKNE